MAVCLLLLGALLRAVPLTQNRFHPDEALFATLARLIVSGRDPLLSQTSLLVDKPPLAYYLLSGSIALVGASEFAARLPNFLASLITLALIAHISQQLWARGDAALVSLTVMVFSPFSILFAPTVFSDPLMIMWLLAALSALLSEHGGRAGLLFGLALATKPNALFFLPLIIALAVVRPPSGQAAARRSGWLRFVVGLAIVFGLVASWDWLRQPAASFWAAGAAVNNPGRLARSAEVWPRARAWLDWLYYLSASPAANVLLALLIGLAVPLELLRRKRDRRAAATLVLAGFVLAYLALNWLVAFPILDRYLLPAVPLFALLAGRGWFLVMVRFADGLKANRARLLIIATGLLVAFPMIFPAIDAARSAFPVGGDHGPNDGIDQVAAYLSRQPWGTVVYSRQLDWLVRYYLFDAYVFPVFADTPSQLSADLHTFGAVGPPRYVALSSAESLTEIADAVDKAGFRLEPVLSPVGRSGKPTMTLYRLVRQQL